jgi:hypothetical protein
MDDLVKRLRDYERWLTNNGYGGPSFDIDDLGPNETFGPAADTIESLTARLAEAEGGGVMGAWAEMDDWCKRRAEKMSRKFTQGFHEKRGLDDRMMRHWLGEASAYAAMRSFIHGERNAKDTRP